MSQAQKTVYAAREGSVCDRSIAHLLSLPADTIIETAQLADAVGAPISGMMAVLNPAVMAGTLIRHKIPKGANGARTNGYSLDPFFADETRGGQPARRLTTTSNGGEARPPTGSVSVFDLARDINPAVETLHLYDNTAPEPTAKPATPAGLNWKPGKPLVASAAPPDTPEPDPEPPICAAKALTEPTTPPPSLECALWSNGELWLRIDGAEPLVLDETKTRQLIHYLDHMVFEQPATT